MDQHHWIQESKEAHHQAELSCICSFGEGSKKAPILKAALITSPFPKHLQQREVSTMHDLVLSSVGNLKQPVCGRCCEPRVASETWMLACCRSRVQSAQLTIRKVLAYTVLTSCSASASAAANSLRRSIAQKTSVVGGKTDVAGRLRCERQASLAPGASR